MITREQVADLREGDVVEVRGYLSLKGAAVTGPVWSDGETKKLCVGPFVIRHRDGDAPTQYDDDPEFTLTVVSRAPRPFYVNHPRTEPTIGDIVRDCDGDAWSFDRGEWWCASPDACDDDDPDALPIEDYRPLTLLWDGETGRCVP